MQPEIDGDELSSVREFVARVLTDIDGQDVTAVIAVPVPFAPLSTFLRAVPRASSVLWDPRTSDRLAVATSGSVHEFNVSGRDRFAEAQRQADAIFKRIRVFGHPECSPPPPRLFGGFAFDPGSADAAPWEEFSDGSFVLPRWTYARDTDQVDSVLCLTADGLRDRGFARREELMGTLEDLLFTLYEFENNSTKRTTAPVLTGAVGEATVEQLPYEDWEAHIEKILDAIKGGAFGKVVAARRCDITLGGPVDDIDVVTRLGAEPNCTRFAFRAAKSTFLGASPEVLLDKRGNEVNTQALAGTLRSLGSELPMASERSEQFLSSNKDRSEHEFVVKEIREALTPFCSKVGIADRPSISKIRSILHLNTPIVGTLKDDATIWQVVEALHPTPAVGGVPKRAAADWIAANEPNQRGWYTGTVGWVDAEGDGRFIVAIRCGLVTERKAYIFTGGGIVADSDPAAEYAETDLKQLPLLRALGAAR